MTTTPARPFYARPLTWILAVVVIVVLVIGIIVGVRMYAQSQNDTAPGSFASEAPGDSAATAGDIAGAWAVAEGSEAGYRVDEVLNGEDVTVVGRTSEVTGEATVEDTTLTEGSVSVDLASVTTDEQRRDEYFTSEAIDTQQYPEAVFTVTEDVDLAAVAEEGSASVEVPGTIEMNGQTQDVTAALEVERTDEGLTITGASDVTWSDYGVEAPNLGFVSVEDAGQIEFSLQLTQS